MGSGIDASGSEEWAAGNPYRPSRTQKQRLWIFLRQAFCFAVDQYDCWTRTWSSGILAKREDMARRIVPTNEGARFTASRIQDRECGEVCSDPSFGPGGASTPPVVPLIQVPWSFELNSIQVENMLAGHLDSSGAREKMPIGSGEMGSVRTCTCRLARE